MKTNGYLGNITTIVLAPVVQRVDNAIHWISVDQAYYANHWLVIYQVDSVIHPFNIWGLEQVLFTLLIPWH